MADEMHTLAGAYALGALPDDERGQFEEHLRGCESCREEVRSLTETAARLGTAAAEPPPSTLRDRVMDEVDRTPQVPPQVDELAARRARRAGLPWSARTATWFAAACLVAAVAVGVVAVRVQGQAEQLRAERARIAAVLSAPDAHITASAPTGYGRGVLVSSHSSDRLVFTLSQARALPTNRAYQLWYVSPRGQLRSAGLLTEKTGRSRAAIASSIGDARQVGLTVEPAGGSRQPTMKPIMALDLR